MKIEIQKKKKQCTRAIATLVSQFVSTSVQNEYRRWTDRNCWNPIESFREKRLRTAFVGITF